MKTKRLLLTIVVSLLLFFFFGMIQPVQAQTEHCDADLHMSTRPQMYTDSDPSNIQHLPVVFNGNEQSMTIVVHGLNPDETYSIEITTRVLRSVIRDLSISPEGVGTVTITRDEAEGAFTRGGRLYGLREKTIFLGSSGLYCQLGTYEVPRGNDQAPACQVNIDPPFPDRNTPFEITISGFEDSPDRAFQLNCWRDRMDLHPVVKKDLGRAGADRLFNVSVASGEFPVGTFECQVIPQNLNLQEAIRFWTLQNYSYCDFSITIFDLNEDPLSPPGGFGPLRLLKPDSCTVPFFDSKGIKTAVGCFPINPETMVPWFLKFAVIFSGGIGFLSMLWSSFQIITSRGDPEKLKAGQQMLTSVIVGILLIVSGVFLLRFIGYNILRIPGWQ